MSMPPPVRVDLVVTQGSTLNQTIWNMRDGTGAVVDLSAYSANTVLQSNYLQVANVSVTEWITTIVDENGAISLMETNSRMATIPANTYVFNTILTTANTQNVAVYGVIEVRPSTGI